MKLRQLRHTLPKLPRGCDELQATAAPTADIRLRAHLDSLPGLDIERADLLAYIAEETTETASDGDAKESRRCVLGIDDLLRTQTQGYRALHPRVQQVVPLDALDPLLETLAERLNKRTDFLPYQYPNYLLECRSDTPDKTSLYGSQYHIRTLELLRAFRENNFLTTVCQGEEPLPPRDVISDTVESMQDRNEDVQAVFTLRQDDASRPCPTALVFHDDIDLANAPSQEEILSLCTTLRNDFGVVCRFVTISTYR